MADLSTRPAAGRVATVFVLAAAAAVLGQWCFARGHALVGGQYEALVAWRTAALPAFAAAAVLMALLCRMTRAWEAPVPRRAGWP